MGIRQRMPIAFQPFGVDRARSVWFRGSTPADPTFHLEAAGDRAFIGGTTLLYR